MDSRIREIEQWIAEAKSDLGECGREAYLRKLYLLDAEIKAVLKENHGILPEAVSPRPRGKRVRRFATPGLALSGALAAVLLLTASTVYLSPMFTVRNTPSADSPRLLAQPAADFDYLPARLPDGEVLVTADWQPLADEAQPVLVADAAAALDQQPGSLPARSSSPIVNLAAADSRPASGRPTYTEGGSGATPVVILAGLPAGGARPPQPPVKSAPAAAGSFGSSGAIIAREARYPSEAEFRQDFSVNYAKEAASAAARSGDGSLPAEIILTESVDNVDNKKSTSKKNVDKLDPDALKETLEKPFNR